MLRDYRLTTACCFAYPVIGAGGVDLANDRQLELLRTMVERAATRDRGPRRLVAEARLTMAEHRRACASCGTRERRGRPLLRRLRRIVRADLWDLRGGSQRDRAILPSVRGAARRSGRASAGRRRAGPARKTVTVMFADLAGSTTFEEQVDAETAREVIGSYHDLLRSTAERNRAGVTKYIGDGFMAVWGVPEMGPDDAGHAVDAAVELQERFVDFAARVSEAHGVDLALRVAVNTGEVVVGAGDADLVGDALNVAARLEAECPRGEVVVGEETWRARRAAGTNSSPSATCR